MMVRLDFGGRLKYGNMADGWAKISKFNVDSSGVSFFLVFQGCFYSISNPGSREQQVFEDADLSRLRGSPGNCPADDDGASGELFSLFFLTVLKKWEIACC